MSERDDVLERLRRLEDIEAIRKVMALYCENYDTGWPGAGRDSAAVAALFTEDATWDAGPSGVWTGREAIGRWCAELGHAAQLSVHIAMNPRVEVDGDIATGTWSALCPLVTPDGEALWVCGRYRNRFRRTDDGWRIAEMVFAPAFLTPYAEGFGRTRFLQSASYDEALHEQASSER